MITTMLSQPESQLGNEFTALLSSDSPYTRIVFVSAFTALRTILRLREDMLFMTTTGTTVRFILGIDLGGTSRDVLEELSRWGCDVFIYHNPIPITTFHPKIYLFERLTDSTLFLGSNNLTDGGLYTNYEAAMRCNFTFPADKVEYEQLLQPINRFLDPLGPTVRRLDAQLIETLSIRGSLTTEIDARRSRRNLNRQNPANGSILPPDPFSSEAIPRPPLLPRDIRETYFPARPIESPQEERETSIGLPRPEGVLVWRKVLPRTDALQVTQGSHHVGGVRLTQAGFENPTGHIIDQTTYFRSLFDDYDWEPEPGGRANQEHTFVPIRIIIRGNDYGIRNIEISHKPTGEAGQDNYTTILRWGRDFNSEIIQANITSTIFSLYETPDSTASFFIDITNT